MLVRSFMFVSFYFSKEHALDEFTGENIGEILSFIDFRVVHIDRYLTVQGKKAPFLDYVKGTATLGEDSKDENAPPAAGDTSSSDEVRFVSSCLLFSVYSLLAGILKDYRFVWL